MSCSSTAGAPALRMDLVHDPLRLQRAGQDGCEIVHDNVATVGGKPMGVGPPHAGARARHHSDPSVHWHGFVPSVGQQLVFGLGDPAHRAAPVFGKVFERRAWRKTIVGQPDGFVVDEATGAAFIESHVQGPLDRAQVPVWRQRHRSAWLGVEADFQSFDLFVDGERHADRLLHQLDIVAPLKEDLQALLEVRASNRLPKARSAGQSRN